MKKKGSSVKTWTEIETGSFMKLLFDDLKAEAADKETIFVLEKTLPGRLRLDSSFLRESFLELFRHCVQKTGEEAIFFSVSGDSLDEGGYILKISVSEGGEGFTAEELELLDGRKEDCQEVFLSKLYAIRKGAEERKGDFSVYSTAGGGAVYYIILPCEALTSLTVLELEEEDSLHNIEETDVKIKENPLEHVWINRKLALNYAGEMEEMRLELLNIYYEQAQQYLKELPEIFAAKDWEKYRITVHAIKGNSLGIGAESFSKEAYEQEVAARDGNIRKIEAEFDEFYEHYQSLVEEVKRSKD